MEILPDNIGDETDTGLEKSKDVNPDVVLSTNQQQKSPQTTSKQQNQNLQIASTSPPPPQILLPSHEPSPQQQHPQSQQLHAEQTLQPYFHRLPNGQIVLIQPYPMSNSTTTTQPQDLKSSTTLQVADTPSINPLAFGAVSSNITIEQPAMLDAGLQKIQNSSFVDGGGADQSHMTAAQPLFVGGGALPSPNTVAQSPPIDNRVSPKTDQPPPGMLDAVGLQKQQQQQLQNSSISISPFSSHQTHPFRSQIMTRKMKREQQQQQQQQQTSQKSTPKESSKGSNPSPLKHTPVVSDSQSATVPPQLQNHQQQHNDLLMEQEKRKQQKQGDRTLNTKQQTESSSSFSSLSGAESNSSMTNRLRVNSRLPAACDAPETEPILSFTGIAPPLPSLNAGDTAATIATVIPNEPRFEPVKLDSGSDSEWSVNSKDDDDQSRDNARQIMLQMQGANQKPEDGELANQKEVNTLYSPITADSSLVVNKRNRNRSTKPSDNSKVRIVFYYYNYVNQCKDY